MQTARRLDPQLRADIERLAERLVPPATNEAAEALAGAGEMLLDLLRAKPPQNSRQKQPHPSGLRPESAAMPLCGLSATSLHATPSHRTPRVDDEVISAWRFFKPDVYVKEVLARSWPPEKELQVPDPAFMEVLHIFPALRAVRCELRNHRTGAAELGPCHHSPAIRTCAA